MTSRRFFFNSGLIRQNLRQHSWIAVIYLLGLLFGLPLQLFLRGNPDAPPQQLDNLFGIGDGLPMLFTLTLPVGAGLLLFRYLQHKGAADMMHSLPLRRKHLLTAQLFSGAVLLLVPVWLAALAAGLVRNWDGNMYLYSGADVWSWGATVSLLTLFLFTLTLFVGVCLGLTVLHGIVVYILLLLPAVLFQLIFSHLNIYLYGFSSQYGLRGTDNWSPLVHMMNIGGAPYTWAELSVYAALTVLFVALSYWLYRRRPTETAGQAIAFTYFNPLFKGGVMLCAMLISGTYFAQMRSHNAGWAITGFALGAVIGYGGAEMVIRKSWHILNRKLPARFIGYTAVLGLLLYLPVSPVTGYETRVPAVNQVAGIYAGNYYGAYTNSDTVSTGSEYTTVGSAFKGVDPFSSDPAYIAAVRGLHAAVVQARPGEGEDRYKDMSGLRSYTIVYKLKDGSTVSRQYAVPRTGFEPEVKAVMESGEFKRFQYALPQLDKELANIQITSGFRSITLTDPAEITVFKKLLKEEYLNMSYNEQVDDIVPPARINIIPQESIGRPYSFSYLEWKPSFKKLSAWLQQKGYADRIEVKPGDVASVELVRQDAGDTLAKGSTYGPDKYFDIEREQNRTVTIKDKERVGDVLRIRRNYMPTAGSYAAFVIYKNGNRDYYRLVPAEMTPELKRLLP